MPVSSSLSNVVNLVASCSTEVPLESSSPSSTSSFQNLYQNRKTNRSYIPPSSFTKKFPPSQSWVAGHLESKTNNQKLAPENHLRKSEKRFHSGEKTNMANSLGITESTQCHIINTQYFISWVPISDVTHFSIVYTIKF